MGCRPVSLLHIMVEAHGEGLCSSHGYEQPKSRKALQRPANGTPACLLLTSTTYRYCPSPSAPRPQTNPSLHEFWRHFKIQIITTSYQAKICNKMDIGVVA